MNAYPEKNSVLVMDDTEIRHGGHIEALGAAHGVQLLYLSPYSPDFNPIEKSFGVIKDHLCRSGISFDDLTPELKMAAIYDTVTKVLKSEMCQRFFGGAGYL